MIEIIRVAAEVRKHSYRNRAAILLAFALSLGTLRAQQRTQPVDDADQPVKTTVSNPDAVAVLIGVSEYQDRGIDKVEFALNDVDAVRRVLVQTMGYNEGRILTATNLQASIGRMKSLIRQGLSSQLRAGVSDVFVYYSGHGAPNPATKEGYLIPWDYDPNYPPTSDSAYALKDLYADLGKLGARSVTVVLESCFSGASDGGRSLVKDASLIGITVDNPGLALVNGMVITASGGSEIATWDRAHSHGLMTYYWLRAMRGEATDAQGNVTATALNQYLTDKVPPMARQLKSRTQTPEVFAAQPGRSLVKLPVSALVNGGANLVKTYGSLHVSIDVGGDLYIDGVRQGTIQPGVAFDQPQISTGKHSLEVRKEGYENQTFDLVVAEGDRISHAFRLASALPNAPRVQQLYGLIEVTVDRGGTLFIDGKTEGEVPAYAPYTTAKITAGPHQLRVEKAGFVTVNREVMVPPNQTAPVSIAMLAGGGAPTPASSAAAIAAAPPVADRPASPPPGVNIDFVRIQPGTFMMGCSPSDTDCGDNEKPVHRVTITKGFELGKHELTQAQWQAVMGVNPSTNKGDNSRPVEHVSWDDAQSFLAKMNARNDGYRYRLPTEAEWEYAARAGTTSAHAGNVDQIAWYRANSGNRTRPVGQKDPNAWGLYDMQGNVAEWVQDRYGAYFKSAVTDPAGLQRAPDRVVRGGDYYYNDVAVRVSSRSYSEPDSTSAGNGFRVVRVAAAADATTPVAVAPAATAASLGLEFVGLQPGTFTMGCAKTEFECDSKSNENPAHTVRITKGFDIAKYELTQAQWQELMGSDPHQYSANNGGNFSVAVDYASWNDAQSFLAALNARKDGYRYRLPTEAEWEYAARAGTTTPHAGALEDTVWYHKNANAAQPVGQKKPNAWGLYDMEGNASEWVQDWYDDYKSSAVTDPTGPTTGKKRILRGGSWGDDASRTRVSVRYDLSPVEAHASGIRIVREGGPPAAPPPPAPVPVAVAPALPTADRPALPAPSSIQIDMQFVRIQAGTFLRGCSANDRKCDSNEKPQHPVTITKSFELGKYEVTQTEWQAVMGKNPSKFTGDTLPVDSVSWNDTQSFLAQMNARSDGYRYRLPTEAEWEYAARAGTTGSPSEPEDSTAWYANNSGRTALDADAIFKADIRR